MNHPPDTPLSSEVVAALGAPMLWQKGTPIYVEVYRRLQRLIVDGTFQKGDRLPSETQLAAAMNVGRTSLRSAIILLFEDGYVKTYHGKGTYVVYGAEGPQAAPGFPSGYVLPRRRLAALSEAADVAFSFHRRNSPDAFLDERLQLDGAPINAMARLYTLDGAHAVLTYCYYPARLLDGDPRDDDVAWDMMETCFDEQAAGVDCTFTAVPADSVRNIDSGLTVVGDNFLLVSATWYTADRRPLAYCKDYYCDIVRYRANMPPNKNGQ